MQVLQAGLETEAGTHSLKESVGVRKRGPSAGGAAKILGYHCEELGLVPVL